MIRKFRKLNEAGIAAFRNYIRKGAEEPPPFHLLDNPNTTTTLQLKLSTGPFDDRYIFGIYLNTVLKEFEQTAIGGDVGLWSSLALFWFDSVCPPDANGNRSMMQEYKYILSSDYRHYYRHLVRSPWMLVNHHGAAARFLLVSPRKQTYPLSIHGEILEQFGARQQVLSSQRIIKAANKLYFDIRKERPRAGVTGKGRGGARRFALILRQLDLTYDPDCMSESDFISILPDEFEKWRKLMAADRSSAA